ncbi:hypothetical protein EJB05_49083 [Eragrostis curvula]|uniref:Uncharacterized protein n=1 Tax=Eragrostis curvula TaxID=38414 RepID=A0A5J9T3C3_9POAL|nr:hypothetical protein EJB05_49083 [Eragrostis curvula]
MELLIHYMSDSGPEEKQRPASSAPIMVKVSDCSAILYVGAQLAFFVLAMVGGAVHASSHVKRSTNERVGLAIMALGFYGFCWLPCLVLFPAMALDGWRRRRAGWRWGGKYVGKPSRGAAAVMMGKEPQALSIC